MNVYETLLAKKLGGESGGGTGTNLPSVTNADNMKALAVVNGQWAVGDAGYKVEEMQSVVIPQQTVQCEESEYGISQAPLTNVTLDPSYSGAITFVYDGVTYADVDAITDPSGNAFWIIPDLENEIFEFYYDYGWYFYAENTDSHTIKGITNTEVVEVSDGFQKARGYGSNGNEMFVTDDFSDAVNSCVEPPTPQSELPDISGHGGAFLQVNKRAEGVQWKNFGWTVQSSSTNPVVMKNDDLKIKRYYFSGEVVTVRSLINQTNFGSPTAHALLSLYSSNGLEIVYDINTSGQAVSIYDKNTTSGDTGCHGDVIVFY